MDNVEDLEIKLSQLHGNLDELKADIRISVKRGNWGNLQKELRKYEDLLGDIQDLTPKIHKKVEKILQNKK